MRSVVPPAPSVAPARARWCRASGMKCAVHSSSSGTPEHSRRTMVLSPSPSSRKSSTTAPSNAGSRRAAGRSAAAGAAARTRRWWPRAPDPAPAWPTSARPAAAGSCASGPSHSGSSTGPVSAVHTLRRLGGNVDAVRETARFRGHGAILPVTAAAAHRKGNYMAWVVIVIVLALAAVHRLRHRGRPGARRVPGVPPQRPPATRIRALFPRADEHPGAAGGVPAGDLAVRAVR